MSIVDMINYSQKTVDFQYYYFPLSYHLTSYLFITVVDAFGTKQMTHPVALAMVPWTWASALALQKIIADIA